MSATLTEINTIEVSLVTRGANRKRFALRKEEFVKKPIKTRKEEVKKPLDGLSEVARAAVMRALQALASVRDELPPDLLDVVARELGYGGADEIEIEDAGPDDPDREYPAPNPEEPPPMSTEKTPTQKTEQTAQLSPDAKAQIEKAEKDALAASAQTVELKKQVEASEAKRVELEKQIAVEKDARLTRDFIAKAAEKFKHLPEKADVLGPILKELADKAPEAAAKIEKFLEATNEKLAKVTELTKELGHNRDGGEQTAWGKIQKAAEELRKTEVKLSKEQAIQKAMELNPDLYEAYNAESGQRS